MADDCEENQCSVCPKAFCCLSCRLEHETLVHKIQNIVEKYCTCKPMQNEGSEIADENEHSVMAKTTEISATKTEITADSAIDETEEEENRMDSHNKTNATPKNFNNKDKSTFQVCDRKYEFIGATSTPYNTNPGSNSNFKLQNDETNTEDLQIYVMIDADITDVIKIKSKNQNSNVPNTIKNVTFCDDPKIEEISGAIEEADSVILPIESRCAISDEKENIIQGSLNIPLDTESLFEIIGDKSVDINVTSTGSPSKSPSNETLWKSANEFTDQDTSLWSKECDYSNLEKSDSAPKSDENPEFKSILPEEISDCENDEKFTSSTSNISILWKSISNSIRKVLKNNSETFNGNVSKRNLNNSTEAIEPTAKRRKYEPQVKCRPPIHDLESIVCLRVNGKPVIKFSRSTQTEECYFK